MMPSQTRKTFFGISSTILNPALLFSVCHHLPLQPPPQATCSPSQAQLAPPHPSLGSRSQPPRALLELLPAPLEQTLQRLPCLAPPSQVLHLHPSALLRARLAQEPLERPSPQDPAPMPPISLDRWQHQFLQQVGDCPVEGGFVCHQGSLPRLHSPVV